MNGAVRILVVDDHPSVLRGLELVFRGEPGVEVVASAATGEAAIECAEAERPDIAIVDIRLPGIDGITTIKRLGEVAPDAASLVYSGYGDRRLLTDAIAAGARGYVLKSSPAADLLRAVLSVSSGTAYVDPTLSPSLLMEPSAPDAPLAERERDILQLLAGGMHTGEVAEHIGLSSETVKSDTRRAVERLEATGRVHAVANALRRALIE